LDHVDDYNRAEFTYYNNGKHFYIDGIGPVVEKYKALPSRHAEERVAEYTKELAEQSRDRAQTGADMLKWHLCEMDIQAKQVAARKNARLERSRHSFWKNIKPKVEFLLRRRREERLEQEREQRRYKRGQELFRLYRETAREAISLPSNSWGLPSFVPDQQAITTLPRVQEILETDTEGITEGQWLEVLDDVRTLVQRHWIIVLRRVLAVVETGKAPPAGVPTSPNEKQNDQKLTDDIAATRGKLSLVTSSFVCKSGSCKEIHWFPDVFMHAYCQKPAEDLSGLLGACVPLNAERKKLVTRMVDNLGLDQESATDVDVKHYIQAQQWYFYVKQAKEIRGHTHTVIDDHDWLSDDSPLVRQDDEGERASIESLQEAFRNQTITDPTCDTRGIGGEDLRLNIVEREILRCCRLCPQDMSPLPCSTLVMNIHIRTK
ncbi:hypothetical protein FRC01_006387, partial [Tulasnella sp. 417]